MYNCIHNWIPIDSYLSTRGQADVYLEGDRNRDGIPDILQAPYLVTFRVSAKNRASPNIAIFHRKHGDKTLENWWTLDLGEVFSILSDNPPEGPGVTPVTRLRSLRLLIAAEATSYGQPRAQANLALWPARKGRKNAATPLPSEQETRVPEQKKSGSVWAFHYLMWSQQTCVAIFRMQTCSWYYLKFSVVVLTDVLFVALIYP